MSTYGRKKKALIFDEEFIPLRSIAVKQQPQTEQTETKPASQVVPAQTSNASQQTSPGSTSLLRPGSISISGKNTSNANNAADTNTVSDKQQLTLSNPFTQDDIIKAWHEFTVTIPDQSRMVSYMQNNFPVLLSHNLFEIKVNNVLQEKEMLRLQSDLMTFIHQKIKNTQLKMRIVIEEDTEALRNERPEEKLKQMIEQNPAIDILKNRLSLELD